MHEEMFPAGEWKKARFGNGAEFPQARTTNFTPFHFLSDQLLSVTVMMRHWLQNALDILLIVLNVTSIQKTPSTGRKEAQQLPSEGRFVPSFSRPRSPSLHAKNNMLMAECVSGSSGHECQWES
jgi:hypothetical protein